LRDLPPKTLGLLDLKSQNPTVSFKQLSRDPGLESHKFYSEMAANIKGWNRDNQQWEYEYYDEEAY
jgi:hypothetical protein